MHTINVNVVRGRSYEKFLHENLSCESFFTRKFPDLQYMQAHTQIHNTIHTDPLQSASIMGLLWSYYCSSLSQPSTPRYVLSTYHSTLEELPWSLFFPDLASMDSMMKLRFVNNHSSFVFLGQIFPLFDWKTIAAAYRSACMFDDLYHT